MAGIVKLTAGNAVVRVNGGDKSMRVVFTNDDQSDDATLCIEIDYMIVTPAPLYPIQIDGLN